MNDRDRLELQAATIFELDSAGRIVSSNAPDRHPGPLLYMAGSEAGNIVLIRQDIDEEAANAVHLLAACEPPLINPDTLPSHLHAYVRLLRKEHPKAVCTPGLIWTYAESIAYDTRTELVQSGTSGGDRLLSEFASEMPPTLHSAGFFDTSHFWAPWCVAMHEGEVASIAFTPGLAPSGAEAGVYTMALYRGRGYAAAAVAGWANHEDLRGKERFYSTDASNASSRRVAQRLGLRFIGARWWFK